ncbi:hypothetical protein DES49_0749 [Halospina denitrificans]|uniref:Uncharacterized protein n=1 Tax=Halospina denitrificans TaxID=332522 RepID=A0A4R7K0J6_9GAMM|nr:hypothetical protein [Halospina denitrificans]TDT42949.1 hypothetical protein DES49_0749 [Halospina denitrificans]
MTTRIPAPLTSMALVLLFAAMPVTALASGEIGDHVEDLKAHLGEYDSEVKDFNAKVDGLVDSYAEKGGESVNTAKLIEWWEDVKFHAAVEVNYVPVYASIWQGIYGVKEAIDEGKAAAEVRKQQRALEQAMWKGMGAVMLAAKNQADGGTSEGDDSGKVSGSDAVDRILTNLDEVTIEYAENESEEATEIIHNTYLNLFEGIEGALIEQDAELVEDLEKDFNVGLPKLIENGASVSEVTDYVKAMKKKLKRAQKLLEKGEQDKKDVF